jgi:hypothetical protein
MILNTICIQEHGRHGKHGARLPHCSAGVFHAHAQQITQSFMPMPSRSPRSVRALILRNAAWRPGGLTVGFRPGRGLRRCGRPYRRGLAAPADLIRVFPAQLPQTVALPAITSAPPPGSWIAATPWRVVAIHDQRIRPAAGTAGPARARAQAAAGAGAGHRTARGRDSW